MLLSRDQAQRVVLGKVPIALFSLLLVGATLAPVRENFRSPHRDGFPFSYYPMFSQPLGELFEVSHAVGIDAQGRERAIHYKLLGPGGLNEVLSHVRHEVRHNPAAFCQSVAHTLRDDGDATLREVREVALVTGAYRLRAFYEGRMEADSRQERARCPVPP